MNWGALQSREDGVEGGEVLQPPALLRREENSL